MKWFDLKLSKAELEYQAANYNQLKIGQSYRGVALIVMIIILAVSAVLVTVFNVISLDGFLLSLLYYIPLIIFAYFGHRWAIVLLMILWTIEKITGIIIFDSSIWLTILWWIIVFSVLYRSLQVENYRKRKMAERVEGSSDNEKAVNPAGSNSKNIDAKKTVNWASRIMVVSSIVLAIFIAIGLAFQWTFDTWRVFDIILLLFLIVNGVVIARPKNTSYR